MNRSQRVAEAERVAAALLALLASDRPLEWAGLTVDSTRSSPLTYWWHDHIELHEVCFANKAGPAGYALIAPDSRLPPVLQFTSKGMPLSTAILAAYERTEMPVDKEAPDVHRVLFLDSMHFYLELREKTGTPCLFDPARRQLFSRSRLQIPKTDPTTRFDPRGVAKLWATLVVTPPSSRTNSYVIDQAPPVLYQQDCEFGKNCAIGLDAASTRCAPAAIAGCGPVAWAMLASSYKKLGLSQSGAIWPNSTDWQLDWDTNAPSPSRSTAVRSTIWIAHREMGTDPNGSTSYLSMVLGQNIFRHMGISWDFKSDVPQSVVEDFPSQLLHDRPFIWDAQGPWPEGSGVVQGHSVLVFGFNLLTETFRVGFGWGDAWTHTDVHYRQYLDFHWEYPREDVLLARGQSGGNAQVD